MCAPVQMLEEMKVAVSLSAKLDKRKNRDVVDKRQVREREGQYFEGYRFQELDFRVHQHTVSIREGWV